MGTVGVIRSQGAVRLVHMTACRLLSLAFLKAWIKRAFAVNTAKASVSLWRIYRFIDFFLNVNFGKEAFG